MQSASADAARLSRDLMRLQPARGRIQQSIGQRLSARLVVSKSGLRVLHGGAGTSAALFRAGIPGVFIPHGDFYDQRYWAQLAEELGCAVPAIPFQN